MKKYVMFGHNQLLGDFVDIIHLNGGKLVKVVQNIPEPISGNRKSLAERLNSLRLPSAMCSDAPSEYEVQVHQIKDFKPEAGESYVIGFTGFKMKPLREQIKSQFAIVFETLVHPSAYISPLVALPEGGVINANVTIASGVGLGKHVFINRGATIGHDTVLQDYVIVQPGANLAGHIRVGEGATIGMGACVIEDRLIGEHSMIAAGSVVTQDVQGGTLVAGNPARFMKSMNT